MSRQGKDPHNALFLSTFGQIEHARSYLEALVLILMYIEETKTQIEAGEPDELELWTERILSASSIDEVFQTAT